MLVIGRGDKDLNVITLAVSVPFIIPSVIITTSLAPRNVLSSVTLRQQAVPAKKNKTLVLATLFNHCPLGFYLLRGAWRADELAFVIPRRAIVRVTSQVG